MDTTSIIVLSICLGFGLVCALLLIWHKEIDKALARRQMRKMFYLYPRQELKKAAKEGRLLYVVDDFISSIEDGSLNGFPSIVAVSKIDGQKFSMVEAMSSAVVDFVCYKKKHKRWFKRFPEYRFIDDLDFTEAVKQFGGCIKKYEQL